MTQAVFIAHVVATLIMVGVIWVVQLVHYPLFAAVGQAQFPAYHHAHVRQISLVVMPAMLVELGGALYLCVAPPRGVPLAWCVVGLALVGVAWLTTALASVPMHDRLAGGFDAEAHRLLVSTNWIRTLAWSARAGLVAAMLTHL